MTSPETSAIARLALAELMPSEVAELAEYGAILEIEAREAADEATRSERFLKAANIWEVFVGEPLRALGTLEGVLAQHPLHEAAFAPAVRLCREHGQWDSLSELYRRAIGETGDRSLRVELHHRLAQVYEEGLQSFQDAFLVLRQAFEEEGFRNDATAVAVERVARRAGRMSDLLSFCSEKIPEIQDEDVKVELCARLGRWYFEVDHAEYATACLNQALQLRPDHVGALQSLALVYKSQSQWESLGQLITHLAQVATDVPAKRDAFIDLGELYEQRLGDVDRASASYQGAIQLDPLSTRASAGLERTSQSPEQWAFAVAAIEQQAAAANEPDDAIAIRRRLATLYEEKLGSAAGAVGAYQAILEDAPGDARALKELERLLTAEERWLELSRVLEQLVVDATSERSRITVLLRLAQLLEARLSRREDAADRLEEVLAIDGTQEDALGALERLYEDLGRWDSLAKTFQRHLACTEDTDALVNLSLALSLVLSEALGDRPSAIETLERARRADPASLEVLDGLAGLYEAEEDWRSAKEVLERLTVLVEKPMDRVPYYSRLGILLAGPLEDQSAAAKQLRRAIDIDGGHRPALAALKDLHLARQEWQAAAPLLEQLQDLTEDPAQRSTLLSELAALNEERLQNLPRAVECYELAVESHAGNGVASERLAELYADVGRLDEAWSLLVPLLRGDPEGMADRPRLLRLQLLRGRVASARGDEAEALEAFEAATRLDPNHLPALRQKAALLLNSGVWDKAFKTLQTVLVRHESELTERDMVELYHGLGISKLKLGERRKALNMLGKALELDQHHRPTLETLLQVHEEHGSWKEVIVYKTALLVGRPDEERVAGLTEIAEISFENLKDHGEAIAHVRQALDIEPSNFPLLHRLLDLHTSAKDWPAAIGVIEKMIGLEPDAARRARYHRTIGVLYRDRLRQLEPAIEHFDKCLDQDSTQLKAFEGIDRMLTEQKDWGRLAEAYRKMLHRIQGTGQTVVETSLWHFLGETYRSRLGQLQPAAEAFEMANRLEPGNVERQVIVAELYGRIPSEAAKAIEKHQLLISWDPARYPSFHSLHHLYLQTKQYDKAWCVASALCLVGNATAEQRAFFDQHRSQNVQRSMGGLDNERWLKDLFVADESLFVGKIFETILPALRRSRVQPQKAFGLKKRNRVDPESGADSLGGLFAWAAQALGMPAPELYVKRHQAAPLLFAVTDPVASVASSTFLDEHPGGEALFEVGRHLASYRGEHYVRCLEPSPARQRMLLLAAIRLIKPATPPPDDVFEMLGETEDLLRDGMAPAELEQLAALVDRILKSQEAVDTTAWNGAVERTACRAGLVVCGDLACAVRMMQRRPPEGTGLSLPDLSARLIAFGISEGYFRLRRAVGISIQ